MAGDFEGGGLAGATECTFTCQDKAGEKHDTVFGAGDFTASADGTRIEVSCDMLVGHMRNACTVGICGLLFNIRRLQRDLFPSEQRGGDALKGFVLADAVHCEIRIALVRLNYCSLSLCHL